MLDTIVLDATVLDAVDAGNITGPVTPGQGKSDAGGVNVQISVLQLNAEVTESCVESCEESCRYRTAVGTVARIVGD